MQKSVDLNKVFNAKKNGTELTNEKNKEHKQKTIIESEKKILQNFNQYSQTRKVPISVKYELEQETDRQTDRQIRDWEKRRQRQKQYVSPISAQLFSVQDQDND